MSNDMQPVGIVALLTDFGLRDGYVASMKGVIMGIAPQTKLIDITHDVGPQNIAEGSFLLQSVCPYYPLGTIFVAVVDPGVGTGRRALAIKTAQAYFVGPDNGLLASVVEAARQHARVEIVELDDPRYWRASISATFHGRDIFAPVAAHLVAGVPFASLGRPVDTIVPSVLPPPKRQSPHIIEGTIIHIDRFGNCVTNITDEDLKTEHGERQDELIAELAGKRIPGLFATYGAGPVGVPIALLGSSDHLEIAVRNSNASQWFGVTVGDRVRVILAKQHAINQPSTHSASSPRSKQG